MGRQGCTAGALLAVLLVGEAATAAPVDSFQHPILIVRVDNVAGVLSDDLQFAEERASDIFRTIAVHIRWIGQEDAVRQRITPNFTIVLAEANKTADGPGAFVDALGEANLTTRRAHVFYDRLMAVSTGTSQTIPGLLGDVIAHELGHFLLPPPGHSPGGIMRPELDSKSWAIRTFTAKQEQEIHTRLANATY